MLNVKFKHKRKIAEEPWHSFKAEEIFKELDTHLDGLSTNEIKERLDFYGENKLPEGKKNSLWQIILHQLINPLIFILIAAAFVSILIGDIKDSIFILLVVFINSILGTYQEYNAEKSASSLKKLLKIKAKVKRDGNEIEIESEKVVPGDIISLESGMKIAADIYLIETLNLEIDESFLTGESIPVKKQVCILPEDTGVADRVNMAFAGSTVIKGRGRGIVVSTGANTQVGIISQDVVEAKSAKPPLIIRMEKFIKQISIFILILSILLSFILYHQNHEITTIFFLVVALAVSAIPEGLPVALTVALSIAAKRMAKRNVIVRRLMSVESLGSCTVIASDKTGTLTVNEQTAKIIKLPNGDEFHITGQGYNGEGKVYNKSEKTKEIYFSDNEELKILTTISVLANEGFLNKQNGKWIYHGDAIDVALLGMCFKLGLDLEELRNKNKIKGKIPYESERKFSASFWETNNTIYIGIKGAVETIIDFCTDMSIKGELIKIDKENILSNAEKLANDGYRVLGFAIGKQNNHEYKEYYENKDLSSLCFIGLVGFIDPLRAEAKESIQKCKEAGIKVIMITGDHPSTAKAIAKELGIIDKNEVISGKMLSEAGPSDSPLFEKLVSSTTVFARVNPTQKLEIVDILIRKGEYIAVTGDGVNDAPALKRANIGVAMGSGTDVAKEISSMIVIDDNFSSIVAGIEEGRFAYDNIRKVIYLLISTGAAEIILFLSSIIVGLPIPLLPAQLLWLNLVTNGIQDVALAFEGGEPDAMKRKPRKPNEKIFNPLMIKQTLISSITISSIVFILWFWLIKFSNINQIHSRTLILLLMVFMQNFHVFNCRSERISAFKIPLKRNILLIFGVIIAQGIHILCMYIPFMQNILRIEPITFYEWLSVLILAIPVILVMELFKWRIKLNV